MLAAIIELADRDGQVLLARNAAWAGRMFALITGFMEAGESPEEGIAREVLEETSLKVDTLKLVGVYEFLRMNQLIIAYHAVARGEIALSPELAEYRLYKPEDIKCWRAGTGYAVADWLSSRGITPQWVDLPPRPVDESLEARHRGFAMQAHKEIDTRGMNCPLPILKAKKALRRHEER